MVAIVNNHWMHYKDLLFRELANRHLDFTVIFSALGSSQRSGTVLEDHYATRVLYTGNYEERPAFKTGLRVWRALQLLMPTTVIIEGWYDISAWAAWLWATYNQVPIILWSESNNFDKSRSALTERLKRFFVSKACCSHVYGRSNRDYLVHLGIPQERVLIDRAVINTAAFLAGCATFESYPLRFLYVGRLAIEKNLQYLLAEFARFLGQDSSGHTLRIVGQGTLGPILEQQARTLRIEKNVSFVGAMPSEQLREIYSTSNIFVLPSKSEPWGLVAAEAMCAGLPAIISAKCGCAADILTEQTGWLFDPDNDGALARVLGQVAATPLDKLRNMGWQARQLGARYSPANAADLVIQSLSLARQSPLPATS